MMDAVLQQRVGELLRHAALVQSYESKLEEIEGRGFNLFHVLRLSRSETSCHSRLLGELLDPKGSHGQGEVFLQNFLEVIGLPDFTASGASVDREFGIGPVTEVSGGRIDLLIRAKNRREQIAVENKIDAGLGEKQLERYAHYLGDQHLVLLTLRNELPAGVDPERLKRDFKIQFRHISYEIEIRDWIKRCLRRTGDASAVRESIRQYLHLIDELTDNNPSQAMNEAIAKMILNGDEETYRAYMALVNARGFVEGKVLERFYERLSTIADGLGLEFIKPHGGLNHPCGSVYFASGEMRSVGLSISLEFEAGGYRFAVWGFKFLDKKDRSPITDSLQKEFRDEFGDGSKDSEWWPAYIAWEDYPHWTPEVFARIANGSFDSEVKTMLQRLLDVFAKACATHGHPQS